MLDTNFKKKMIDDLSSLSYAIENEEVNEKDIIYILSAYVGNVSTYVRNHF